MPAALMAFMARMETTLFDSFWNTSMTKRPPSSGGMGSRFMMPSDTEIIAMNCMNGTKLHRRTASTSRRCHHRRRIGHRLRRRCRIE